MFDDYRPNLIAAASDGSDAIAVASVRGGPVSEWPRPFNWLLKWAGVEDEPYKLQSSSTQEVIDRGFKNERYFTDKPVIIKPDASLCLPDKTGTEIPLKEMYRGRLHPPVAFTKPEPDHRTRLELVPVFGSEDYLDLISTKWNLILGYRRDKDPEFTAEDARRMMSYHATLKLNGPAHTQTVDLCEKLGVFLHQGFRVASISNFPVRPKVALNGTQPA